MVLDGVGDLIGGVRTVNERIDDVQPCGWREAVRFQGENVAVHFGIRRFSANEVDVEPVYVVLNQDGRDLFVGRDRVIRIREMLGLAPCEGACYEQRSNPNARLQPHVFEYT